MATNILAIPIVQLVVETGNNEDWIDALKFLVPGALPEDPSVQLDLRGIHFEMEVRRLPQDHEVILKASTDDGTLAIGIPPEYGFFLVNVPVSEMQYKMPGVYVADVVATADGFTRTVIRIDPLTIFDGVTK